MASYVPRPYPIGNDKTLDPKLSHACAPRHWDPTMIFRYSVPLEQGPTSLPTDPRPWTKVCLEYVNSGPAEPSAPVPPSFLVPGAGEFYPAERYAAAIDNESLLRRLDRPLNNDLLPALSGSPAQGGSPAQNTVSGSPALPAQPAQPAQNTLTAQGTRRGGCYPNQYTVPLGSDVYQQQSLLPPYEPPRSHMVQELEAPSALRRGGQYACSAEAMLCDSKAVPRFWNNHTKLQKYNQKDSPCAEILWQRVNGENPSAEKPPRVYA